MKPKPNPSLQGQGQQPDGIPTNAPLHLREETVWPNHQAPDRGLLPAARSARSSWTQRRTPHRPNRMPTRSISKIQTTLQPPFRQTWTAAQLERRLGRSNPISRRLPCPHCASHDSSSPLQYHMGSHHGRTQHPSGTYQTSGSLQSATIL